MGGGVGDGDVCDGRGGEEEEEDEGRGDERRG